MAYYLYILQMSNGQFYVGTTANLETRLKRHLAHEASRTTTLLGVEKMVYSEKFPDRPTAEKRERQVKKWPGAKKMALVRGDFEELKRLSKRKRR
jgi:predicted GIY-YIG superfamily endonuclease